MAAERGTRFVVVLIEHAGTLTTVQDLGRPTLRRAGLPCGGAVDRLALRTANLLVGNAEDAAVLECALVGPTLRFDQTIEIAVTGARVTGVPPNERFRMAAGTRLNLSRFDTGAFAYVAFAGGIDVPVVLGSRGTDVRLGFGGFEGRALRAGDAVPLERAALPTSPILLRVCPIDFADRDARIRVVDGKDAACVDPGWLDQPFRVSSTSDRAGVRLAGPKIISAARPDAPSAVVLPGTIQLPGDGTPIVLLADAQTLGGYPQIAHVIQADLPRFAQIRPGQAARFQRVTLAAAHSAIRRQERAMAFLRYGIRATIDAHG